VQELLDQYRDWLAANGASADTIRGRTTGARRLLLASGTDDPTKIRPQHLVTVLGTVGSRWSKATYYGHAKNFAKWCSFADLHVEFMTGVNRPRSPKAHPHPVKEEQFERALASAGECEAMMMALGRYQGLRVHEIAKVRGEDVSGRTLYVRGKGDKEANLPLHEAVERRADAFPDEGWWFPSPVADGPVSRSTVWRYIRRAFQRIGVEATPHQLRHLFGTSLVISGSDLRVAQTLLRHESLQTTAIYTDVGDDRLRAAIDRLHGA
jgi:integrase/recombinase XerD